MTLRARLTELRRYLSVGAVCAVLHNLVVITAAQLGLYYILALLLSFVIVTPTGYALHTIYTFEERFSWTQFMRFTGGILGGSLISLAIMFVLCSLLHVAVFIATPLATIALFAWNYLSARWAVLLAHRPRG
jgi:putative flippase GtrA